MAADKIQPERIAQPVAEAKASRPLQRDDEAADWNKAPSDEEVNFRKEFKDALEQLRQRVDPQGLELKVKGICRVDMKIDLWDSQGVFVTTLTADEVIRLSGKNPSEGALIQLDC